MAWTSIDPESGPANPVFTAKPVLFIEACAAALGQSPLVADWKIANLSGVQISLDEARVFDFNLKESDDEAEDGNTETEPNVSADEM